ncbi:hypothetical protein GOODEAATRI_009329, partial [Goodea atripinnis]
TEGGSIPPLPFKQTNISVCSLCCCLQPQKALLFQTSPAVHSDCCFGIRGPVCVQALAVLTAGLVIGESWHSQALERHCTVIEGCLALIGCGCSQPRGLLPLYKCDRLIPAQKEQLLGVV